MRSGTLPAPLCVGLGAACEFAEQDMASENERLRRLRDRFLEGLSDIPELYINGDLEQRFPGNLNISFAYIEGESMLMALKDLAVSSGSACTSASLEPVLRIAGARCRRGNGPHLHSHRYRAIYDR